LKTRYIWSKAVAHKVHQGAHVRAPNACVRVVTWRACVGADQTFSVIALLLCTILGKGQWVKCVEREREREK
jgi:hypothetical protein